MMPPLVLRVARAGAERDERGAHLPAGGGDDGEPALARAAHRGVRVDHVVGAGDGEDLLARLRRSLRRRRALHLRRDRIRHGGKPGAGHVVLHALEARRRRLAQHGCGVAAGEGLGEDADPHHSRPDTSSRRTLRPSAADRAMASMARTEAMPSSMPAPVSGAPSRMAAAKPSSWRR